MGLRGILALWRFEMVFSSGVVYEIGQVDAV